FQNPSASDVRMDWKMLPGPSLKYDGMPKPISPADLLLVDARRICLIKPSALGDIVQTLPLLPILRERFPQARISWVVGSQFADLLEDHPCLDEVIPFHRRGGAWA